jgi:hypothetical protein
MATLGPWLAVAAVGALHGLNPATGWMGAAACGVRAHDRARAWRALLPIALGHALSVALVASVVALGLPSRDRVWLQGVAGGLLLVVAWHHFAGHGVRPVRAPAGSAAMALWSFIVSTAHGAGLMLVPALAPLCIADAPARQITASGSLALALAAVGVHTVAMLAVTGVIASGVCRGADVLMGWAGGTIESISAPPGMNPHSMVMPHQDTPRRRGRALAWAAVALVVVLVSVAGVVVRAKHDPETFPQRLDDVLSWLIGPGTTVWWLTLGGPFQSFPRSGLGYAVTVVANVAFWLIVAALAWRIVMRVGRHARARH